MRCVSYTRTTSCKEDGKIPADIIKQQDQHIQEYLKKQGWTLSAKYCDRKKDTEENTAFEELTKDGAYHITDEMKMQLADFYGNYATEEETAETIRKIYKDCGYVIDTHTSVAATVYKKYTEETGDTAKTVIASTASPYKFTRSVMEAIDEGKYAAMGDFELIDQLSEISGVAVPNAIEEIRNAEVRHNTVADVAEMPVVVKKILGIQ